MYVGLLIKVKMPFQGMKYVKDVGLHSSFVYTAV